MSKKIYLTIRLRRFWWQLRHEMYFYDIPVPPPISPSGGDDAANIQNAVNGAGQTPEWFSELERVYQRKWYRVFLKKPVLRTFIRFQPGMYMVGSPIVLGSNIEIIDTPR